MKHLVLSIAVAAALAAWAGTTHWRLAHIRRERDIALANLEAALHRRQDLTLDLMQLCDGHPLEQPLLEAVALSRAYAMQARTVLAKTKTETDLCWALARLMLAAEADPQLARDDRFVTAVGAVIEAENLAAAAREAYNRHVMRMEAALSHPHVRLLARLLHISSGQMFELDPRVAREAMMSLLGPNASPSRHGSGVPPMTSVAFGI